MKLFNSIELDLFTIIETKTKRYLVLQETHFMNKGLYVQTQDKENGEMFTETFYLPDMVMLEPEILRVYKIINKTHVLNGILLDCSLNLEASYDKVYDKANTIIDNFAEDLEHTISVKQEELKKLGIDYMVSLNRKEYEDEYEIIIHLYK